MGTGLAYPIMIHPQFDSVDPSAHFECSLMRKLVGASCWTRDAASYPSSFTVT